MVAHIAEQTRDVSRPRVFHQARDLLTRFTHGRYRLDVGAEPPHAFLAYDTIDGCNKRLDELSSGTRVQLLMAIRIAFVESLETGPKLPLIIDEALGNTDDARAIAIIETAAELCKDGRQLFYLTAQQVEVERWRAVLGAESTVPLQVIDLAEVRGQAATQEQTPLRLTMGNDHDDVNFAEHSWQELRHVLQVTSIDPWAPDLGHVHVWYLVPTVEHLRHLTRLRIRTWGQLENVEQSNRSSLASLLSDEIMPTAAARLRIIQTFVRYWKHGRSRPIDLQTLVASGVVSERYLEQLSRRVTAVDGDASRLVQALRNGEFAGFREQRIVDLEAYFREHGYLTDMPTLADDEIYAHVVSMSAPDLAAELFSHDDINTLLTILGKQHTPHPANVS